MKSQMVYLLNETATISAIDDVQQVAFILRLLTVDKTS